MTRTRHIPVYRTSRGLVALWLTAAAAERLAIVRSGRKADWVWVRESLRVARLNRLMARDWRRIP